LEILNGLIKFTLFLTGKFNSKVEQIESRTIESRTNLKSNKLNVEQIESRTNLKSNKFKSNKFKVEQI